MARRRARNMTPDRAFCDAPRRTPGFQHRPEAKMTIWRASYLMPICAGGLGGCNHLRRTDRREAHPAPRPPRIVRLDNARARGCGPAGDPGGSHRPARAREQTRAPRPHRGHQRQPRPVRRSAPDDLCRRSPSMTVTRRGGRTEKTPDRRSRHCRARTVGQWHRTVLNPKTRYG